VISLADELLRLAGTPLPLDADYIHDNAAILCVLDSFA